MAANPGRRADLGTEAIRNGSRSIRPAARVMGSNTSSGPASLVVTADNLAGLLMAAGLTGRLRLIFRTLLNGEHWTWILTAICFWVDDRTSFGSLVSAQHRRRPNL